VNGDRHSSSDDEASSVSSHSDQEPEAHIETERPRKRRRIEADDLEASYFQRLAKEDEREQQRRGSDVTEAHHGRQGDAHANGEGATETDDLEATLVHESLAQTADAGDKDKVQRTVFLSNVSIEAIKSKQSRKTLLKHLESALKEEESETSKIESVRFRSTAYTGDSGPKKAGFATKELMEQTTKSTNAYVVFSTVAAAKRVAKKLNGTVVLDRHLRIDHLANPSSIDHKRCVFVGNLNFVDEEKPDEELMNVEDKARRPRARLPADAEEGLWRTFAKVGKVENVRVVRDKHTRIGKGFAYVQFADQNGVEAALLLNEKRFPPMLPRKLRVMRAKKVREKTVQPPRDRNGFLGKSKTSRPSQRPSGGPRRVGHMGAEPKPSRLVFEGHRASEGSTKDGKQKKRRSPKTTKRSAKRGASFKATGGTKKRDQK
jgi:nucleolar protein 12